MQRQERKNRRTFFVTDEAIKSARLSTAALIVIVILFGHLTGCCVAGGYYAGSAIDHHNRKLRETPLQEAESLKKSVEVRVITREHDTYHGRFVGVISMDGEDYRKAYDSMAASRAVGTRLPILGDSVIVLRHSGNSISGNFEGFDYHMGVMRHNAPVSSEDEAEERFARFQYCIIRSPDSPGPSGIYLRDIDRIFINNDDTLGGRILSGLAGSGNLALRSAIAFNTNGGYKTIPINRVAHLSSSRAGAWGRCCGILIGVALEATYWYFSIKNIEIF